MFKFILRLIFLSLFILGTYYIVKVQTEKYESTSIIAVKDLKDNGTINTIGAILTPEASPAARESMLLEVYVRSADMYSYINNKFNLDKYYTSKKLDFLNRLYEHNSTKLVSYFPYFELSKKNLLSRYNSDVNINYDARSASIKLSFLHADSNVSRLIVDEIIKKSKVKLNEIEHESAKIMLNFMQKQEKIKRKEFTQAVKRVINYQNKHNTIDPKMDANAKSSLLADLQKELISKRIQYNSEKLRQKENSPTMRTLRSSIAQLEGNIRKIRSQISGNSSKKRLNITIFDFEILKRDMEFKQELYKQTLMKLEEAKIALSKNDKNIIIISKPTLPDEYSKPNKVKSVLTLMFVLFFIYSIISLVLLVIKSHRD